MSVSGLLFLVGQVSVVIVYSQSVVLISSQFLVISIRLSSITGFCFQTFADSEMHSFEFKSLQDSLEEIKSSVDPSNVRWVGIRFLQLPASVESFSVGHGRLNVSRISCGKSTSVGWVCIKSLSHQFETSQVHYYKFPLFMVLTASTCALQRFAISKLCNLTEFISISVMALVG